MSTKNTRAKNPRIASRTVTKGVPEGTVFRNEEKNDELEQARMDKKIAAKQEFKNLPERLAQHKFYYRNWLWDQDRTCFPIEAVMRHVELYFPYAQGGPLLIDQPRDKRHQEQCDKKKPVILKKGFRYLVLPLRMNENEALEQLDSLGGGDGVVSSAGR